MMFEAIQGFDMLPKFLYGFAIVAATHDRSKLHRVLNGISWFGILNHWIQHKNQKPESDIVKIVLRIFHM